MAKAAKAKRSGRKANKPAQTRYTGEKRWLKNKARKQAKHERELAKAKAARLNRTPALAALYREVVA